MLTIVYDVLKDQEINDFTKYKLMEDFDKVLSLGLLDFSFNDVSLVDEGEILEKIEERNRAKKIKDFVKADEIRDDLLSKGIRLIDTKEGTTYELDK